MATLTLKAVIVFYIRPGPLQLSFPIEEEIRRNQHLNEG